MLIFLETEAIVDFYSIKNAIFIKKLINTYYSNEEKTDNVNINCFDVNKITELLQGGSCVIYTYMNTFSGSSRIVTMVAPWLSHEPFAVRNAKPKVGLE